MINDDTVETEQSRWQEAIYRLLLEVVGDDRIDGNGCDSGDPLDFTLTEIGQALSILGDRALGWIGIDDALPPHGKPVWLWSPNWVDEDFNPEGVRDGFYNDEGIWTSCGWDPCHDVYTTDETSVPLKWAYKVSPQP